MFVPLMDGKTPNLVLCLGWYPALDGPGEKRLTDPDELSHPLFVGGQLVPQAVELVPVHPCPQVQRVDGGHLQKLQYSSVRKGTYLYYIMNIFIDIFHSVG